MKRLLVSVTAIMLILCSFSGALASVNGPVLNYSTCPDVLSGTFVHDWSKGTVGHFSDDPVAVCGDIWLRLDGQSTANCQVGVAVRKFNGSSSTYVSYVIMDFAYTNFNSGYQFYPSNSTKYNLYSDVYFPGDAGTYCYVARSNGPNNLAGVYSAYMNDRLG